MTHDEWHATPEGKAAIDNEESRQFAHLDAICRREGLSREQFEALSKYKRIELVIKYPMAQTVN